MIARGAPRPTDDAQERHEADDEGDAKHGFGDRLKQRDGLPVGKHGGIEEALVPAKGIAVRPSRDEAAEARPVESLGGVLDGSCEENVAHQHAQNHEVESRAPGSEEAVDSWGLG